MSDDEVAAGRADLVSKLGVCMEQAIRLRDSGLSSDGFIPALVVRALNEALEIALAPDLRRLGIAYTEMNYTDLLDRIRADPG